MSVHAPLTKETRKAISTAELESLGPDGILINTVRGEIINERELIETLENGDLAGIGIDVFKTEPPTSGNPLFEHENVIVTPHIGATTAESLHRMAVGAAENVRRFYNGELPETTVNPEAVDELGD